MKQVYMAEDLHPRNRRCGLAEMIDAFTSPTDEQAAACSDCFNWNPMWGMP
jgi:hypothetical protein